MVETKPFKTKLCVLYERGRCARETCTFAHGNSELRRRQASFNDRRIHKDNDLRSKLDRKRSPLHRYSPGRDAQGSLLYKRFTPSLSSKRRKLRIHEHMDGPNDSSGGFRSPDGTADSTMDKKHASSNSRMLLDDELKQVQYEVDLLLNQKSHLEIELEQRVQEADILSSRIGDLETQISEEKDKSKRANSKIKKFIRAHVHHSRLQNELKRSQVQLDQLVGELGVDAGPISEDKLNINIISHEEVLELKDPASPVRKQLHSSMETPQGSKSEGKASENVAVAGSWRNLLVRFHGHQEAEMVDKRKDIARPSNERKPRRRNNASKILDPLDKQKPIELNLVVPPTSMAAHAVDDFVELVEEEENQGVVGIPENTEKGLPFLFPPPLPTLSQNTYFQYEGDDENVDVDGHGHEEEFQEVDVV